MAGRCTKSMPSVCFCSDVNRALLSGNSSLWASLQGNFLVQRLCRSPVQLSVEQTADIPSYGISARLCCSQEPAQPAQVPIRGLELFQQWGTTPLAAVLGPHHLFPFLFSLYASSVCRAFPSKPFILIKVQFTGAAHDWQHPLLESIPECSCYTHTGACLPKILLFVELCDLLGIQMDFFKLRNASLPSAGEVIENRNWEGVPKC